MEKNNKKKTPNHKTETTWPKQFLSWPWSPWFIAQKEMSFMGEEEPADTQTPKYTQAPVIRLKLKKLPPLHLNPAGNPNSPFSRIHSQWDLSPPAGTGGSAAPCPNYHGHPARNKRSRTFGDWWPICSLLTHRQKMGWGDNEGRGERRRIPFWLQRNSYSSS